MTCYTDYTVTRPLHFFYLVPLFISPILLFSFTNPSSKQNPKSMIPSISFSNSVTGIKPKSRFLVACSAAAAPPHSHSLNSLSFSSSTTLYDVLGIRSGATGREIKAAYRRLALERHPDVVADDRKVESCTEFIQIHSAYETLSDPEKRADYDREVMVAALATAGRRWAAAPPRRRPVYRRSPRTWETDQCW